MKIGLLAAGAPPDALVPRYGDYPSMFRRLLAGRGYAFQDYDVRAGVFPAAPEDCEAYLVTGSACGVYDPEPWIADLIAFLRQAKGRARLVGVCFGHQVMAEAFGGRVIKSPKGWGVGLHRHSLSDDRPGWAGAGPAGYALAASHQDQVVEAPPGARVAGGSGFCPMGLIAYGDQPAMSIQLHPEFEPAYAKALIEGRRGERIAADVADAAVRSLDAPDDHVRAAGWFDAFLQGA
ncbi:MAG TPA: type 1 glutamine amidotransferase [Caulobacteraceae bacterium]|nr:type 1 glutamine amidotransferase [Caulobacteraceae bacterium]